jgi:hypothetical protein
MKDIKGAILSIRLQQQVIPMKKSLYVECVECRNICVISPEIHEYMGGDRIEVLCTDCALKEPDAMAVILNMLGNVPGTFDGIYRNIGSYAG